MQAWGLVMRHGKILDQRRTKGGFLADHLPAKESDSSSQRSDLRTASR